MKKSTGATTDFEKLLSENIHSKEQMKVFANSLARLESESRMVPERVWVDGQPPASESFSAVYEFAELAGMDALIKHFLLEPNLSAEILINGKPGRPFDLRVNVDSNIN